MKHVPNDITIIHDGIGYGDIVYVYLAWRKPNWSSTLVSAMDTAPTLRAMGAWAPPSRDPRVSNHGNPLTLVYRHDYHVLYDGLRSRERIHRLALAYYY